jgi:WD40 repeat protein
LRARAATEQQRWDLALLYAAQAQRMEPSADSQMALLSTLQRSPEAVGYLRGDSRILQVAVNGDGTRLVTGDRRGEAIVWDTKTRRRLATLTVSPDLPLWPIDVSDDGRWLASVTYTVPSPGLTGDEAKLYVIDLDAARPGPRQLTIDSVVAVAFTTDPHLMVVRRQDGRLPLVDTTTGTVRKDLAGPRVHGECPSPYLNMSPGRRYLTTGCGQTAEAWDLATNRPIWTGQPATGRRPSTRPLPR